MRSSRRNRSGKAQRAKKLTLCKATVQKNRKGFAFLVFDDKGREDVFIPPRNAERLFPGDRVEVALSSKGTTPHIKVLSHRFRELVGKYTPHPHRELEGWVVYEKKSIREEIFIPKILRPVRAEDWVRIKLNFHEKGPFPVTGEVQQVYGQNLPPSADLAMIAGEYDLVENHSKAALAQAEQFGAEVPESEIKRRKDLRNIPFITIDGETARDFDDAVFVERQKSGYVLWVAIADVSYYVREDQALDQEARSRGTSVYFPERAFHMLPGNLSEGLCSLKPNQTRLALTAKIEFDRVAQVKNIQVMESVISSQRRVTYNQLQTEKGEKGKSPDWEYAAHFELFELLKKMRVERGSIDFELPEAEVNVDSSGEIISIRNRPRLDSHRLVEEFMIAANEAVTEWMMKRNWPFIYRIHEEPSVRSLEKFQNLAATVGIQVKLKQAGRQVVPPKVFAEVVRRLEGHPAQTLLNSALLRSMKQAIYSSTHGIHYGLASEAYTHFTSPIRRYPDLVVHRLIKMVLQSQSGHHARLKSRGKTKQKLEGELAEICEHCSFRERLAAEAEREIVKLKQVRAMSTKLGDEFPSQVVGMVTAGFFVQIKDPFVEGLVSVDSISDDLYEFNEERMVFMGRRKKQIIRIGDSVRVRAVRADLERRQIDFEWVK